VFLSEELTSIWFSFVCKDCVVMLESFFANDLAISAVDFAGAFFPSLACLDKDFLPLFGISHSLLFKIYLPRWPF
jgi:hypothetical protein